LGKSKARARVRLARKPIPAPGIALYTGGMPVRAAALLLLALAACASPEAPPPAAAAAAEDVAPAGDEAGRVLALRPLAPAGRERVAQQILVLAAAGPETGGALALEVLVRIERTGRDVALFHPADPRLRVGDRVLVRFEPRPRLERLGGT
jgi:hypothetical protein